MEGGDRDLVLKESYKPVLGWLIYLRSARDKNLSLAHVSLEEPFLDHTPVTASLCLW